MIFSNNGDLKNFAISLAEKLEGIGEKILSKDLKDWNNEFFTTSSEFLGELKLILARVNDIKALDGATKKDVKECIRLIEKAFGM